MPLIWVTCGFLGGLIGADLLTWHKTTWVILLISSIVFYLGWRSYVRWIFQPAQSLSYFFSLILVSSIAFSLGGIRYQAALSDLDDPRFVAYHADREIQMVITGAVSDFPDVRDKYILVEIETETLRLANSVRHSEVEGKILARVPRGEEVGYGDRLVLRGFLERPPAGEDFSYRDYLARKGIHAVITPTSVGILKGKTGNPILRALYSVRAKGVDVVYNLWPDPEASIMAGILLGVEGGIPAAVEGDFKDTGTSHIIVISGFNITVVAGFFASIFGRLFKPRWGAVAAGVGICAYTILVGADPAVLRAALMGGLALFAQQIGRRQHGLNSVAGASLLMAMSNPHLPWDVSFQLSITATLGLLLFAEDLSKGFRIAASHILSSNIVQRMIRPVSEFILYTFAAQVMTMPVLLFHFQRLSWISYLTNPFILPVQPPIMVLGGLSLCLGLIWLPLGKWAGLLVFPWISYTLRVVEFFAEVQGQALHMGLSGWGVVIYYALVAFLTLGKKRAHAFRTYLKPFVGIALLFFGSLLIWHPVLKAPDGYLHLRFFNVGSGSAILITSPRGERMLINGGSSSSALSAGLGRHLPLMDRRLDLLMVASPLEAEIGALPVVAGRYPPDRVLWIGERSPSRAADVLRSNLKQENIPVVDFTAGSKVLLGNRVHIDVLTRTNRGGILLIRYDSFRALLPYGVSKDEIQRSRDGLDIGHVSLYMLADCGYLGSNPSSWIRNLNPRLGILNVAPDDPRGLPSPRLLEHMAGYSLLRTDVHGWIEITTDGRQMWIDVEKMP